MKYGERLASTLDKFRNEHGWGDLFVCGFKIEDHDVQSRRNNSIVKLLTYLKLHDLFQINRFFVDGRSWAIILLEYLSLVIRGR